MKWVQHRSNSRRDPTIRRAINRWGLEAYAQFWILIELMAENHNENSVGKLLISWTQVQQELHKRRTSVQLLLNFLQNEKKILWEDKGENVFIYMPNFIKYSDRYTKRKLRQSVDTKSEKCAHNVAAYKNRIDNSSSYNTTMETTKEPPMSNLVYRSLKRLIKRGEK